MQKRKKCENANATSLFSVSALGVVAQSHAPEAASENSTVNEREASLRGNVQQISQIVLHVTQLLCVLLYNVPIPTHHDVRWGYMKYQGSFFQTLAQ